MYIISFSFKCTTRQLKKGKHIFFETVDDVPNNPAPRSVFYTSQGWGAKADFAEKNTT